MTARSYLFVPGHRRRLAGLGAEARLGRELGFGAKSAIHPDQLEVVHQVFVPGSTDISWATAVLAALDASGGRPTSSADGEFVNAPVEARARRILASVRAV